MGLLFMSSNILGIRFKNVSVKVKYFMRCFKLVIPKAADIIVIFSNRIWNCSLELGRTACFAAQAFKENKDDQVESIYAVQRCCKQAPYKSM